MVGLLFLLWRSSQKFIRAMQMCQNQRRLWLIETEYRPILPYLLQKFRVTLDSRRIFQSVRRHQQIRWWWHIHAPFYYIIEPTSSFIINICFMAGAPKKSQRFSGLHCNIIFGCSKSLMVIWRQGEKIRRFPQAVINFTTNNQLVYGFFRRAQRLHSVSEAVV